MGKRDEPGEFESVACLAWWRGQTKTTHGCPKACCCCYRFKTAHLPIYSLTNHNKKLPTRPLQALLEVNLRIPQKRPASHWASHWAQTPDFRCNMAMLAASSAAGLSRPNQKPTKEDSFGWNITDPHSQGLSLHAPHLSKMLFGIFSFRRHEKKFIGSCLQYQSHKQANLLKLV